MANRGRAKLDLTEPEQFRSHVNIEKILARTAYCMITRAVTHTTHRNTVEGIRLDGENITKACKIFNE